MSQLFLDLDGVLADFDTAYARISGYRPQRGVDGRDVDWELVGQQDAFYASLPPMPDYRLLWDHAAPYSPIIITGVPWSIRTVDAEKRAWVRRHLGPQVQVITCPSKDKSRYMERGDLLVDDWEKYRHLWVGRGGRWITHTSAANTIRQLREMGYP